MKILPTQPIQTPTVHDRPADDRARATGSLPPVSQPAAQVRRSAFAQTVEDVKPAPVREDIVASVKAQLAAGTFEQSVSLDSVVDSLLADL